MKVIKLKNGMILKEVNRYTDRSMNQMEVVLSSDVIYGGTYEADQAGLIRQTRLVIQESREPNLWDEMKDMSRDQVIEKIHSDVEAYKAQILKQEKEKKAYEKALADAQTAYYAAFSEWEANKALILKKAEKDPTYVLTEAETRFIEKPPVMEEVVHVQEISSLELIGRNGLDYLMNLITAGNEIPELLDFDQIITVGE